MPYRDRPLTGAALEVEIVHPELRARALGAGCFTAALAGALPAAGVMSLSAAAAGAVALMGAGFAFTRRLEPYVVTSTWITVDEGACEVRVERVVPGATARLIASTPITHELSFVATGARGERDERVETVELRRGRATLVEILRFRESFLRSVLFGEVDRKLARVNAKILEIVRRAGTDYDSAARSYG